MITNVLRVAARLVLGERYQGAAEFSLWVQHPFYNSELIGEHEETEQRYPHLRQALFQPAIV